MHFRIGVYDKLHKNNQIARVDPLGEGVRAGSEPSLVQFVIHLRIAHLLVMFINLKLTFEIFH